MNLFIKIRNILDFKDSASVVFLFFFLIIISILEVIGIGLIPILFSVIIGKNLFIYNINIDFINKFFQLNTSNNLLIYLSIFIIIFFLIKNFIFASLIYFQGKVIKNIKISLSKRLLEFYVQKNYLYLLKQNSSVLVRTLTVDIGNSAIYILNIINFLRDFFILIAITIILFISNPNISLFLFSIFSIVVLFFYNINKKNLFDRGKIIQKLSSDLMRTINEIVGLFKEIKIYNLEKFQEKIYADKILINENQILKNYFISSLPRLLLEFTAVFSIISIVIFSTINKETVADILPYLSLVVISSLRLMPVFNGISLSLNTLRLIKPSFDLVIQELVKYNSNKGDILFQNSKKIIDFRSSIEMQNVFFNYPEKNRSVIYDLSLVIKKGDKLGIVGPSGAGKSTLVNLIVGLIKPTSGHILINGKNFISKENIILNNVGYVPQEIYLTDDTIKKNIAIGFKDDEIDEQKLVECAKLSQIYDFIKALPVNFNTVVGERGQNFSVGQKQRIGVARALYRNPELLILDESTSSLDSVTEKSFINDIFKMNNDKTIIFISHRHSALDKCDKIFDLDKKIFVTKSNNILK
jgi:ABC-type multidrug transport system fused ATPase/permease subunit